MNISNQEGRSQREYLFLCIGEYFSCFLSPPRPPPPKFTKFCRFSYENRENADHLQAFRALKPQNIRKKKSFGGLQKSPRKSQKTPQIGLLVVFFDLEYFRGLVCRPPKDFFFQTCGLGPGDSCKWLLGSQQESKGWSHLRMICPWFDSMIREP